MDNTHIIVTETFKTNNEKERKKCIQTKTDNYLKHQLEREGLTAGTVNLTENTV